MAPTNLAKVRKAIARLRRSGGVRPSELQRLAKQLGRTLSDRGKHPTWINGLLPKARPLSIPDHGKELNRFTAQAILDQLEEDVDQLAELSGENDK